MLNRRNTIVFFIEKGVGWGGGAQVPQQHRSLSRTRCQTQHKRDQKQSKKGTKPYIWSIQRASMLVLKPCVWCPPWHTGCAQKYILHRYLPICAQWAAAILWVETGACPYQEVEALSSTGMPGWSTLGRRTARRGSIVRVPGVSDLLAGELNDTRARYTFVLKRVHPRCNTEERKE